MSSGNGKQEKRFNSDDSGYLAKRIRNTIRESGGPSPSLLVSEITTRSRESVQVCRE